MCSCLPDFKRNLEREWLNFKKYYFWQKCNNKCFYWVLNKTYSLVTVILALRRKNSASSLHNLLCDFFISYRTLRDRLINLCEIVEEISKSCLFSWCLLLVYVLKQHTTTYHSHFSHTLGRLPFRLFILKLVLTTPCLIRYWTTSSSLYSKT